MKLMYRILKIIVHGKSIKELYDESICIQKIERFLMSILRIHLKNLDKQKKTKLKTGRQKEVRKK
jgi:hypothetical protein